MTRKATKTELTIAILKAHGSITEAKGQAVHGRYHVGGAVYRLRNEDRYMVPTGYEIVTYDCEDVNGTRYAEWCLEREEEDVEVAA